MDNFGAVFLVWLLGSHVFLVQGIPQRVERNEKIGVRKDLDSSELVRLSKVCDDEDGCDQGSGTEDKIPSKKLSVALRKTDTPVDAFMETRSDKENGDARYEIISQSTTSKETESTPYDAFTAENPPELTSSKRKVDATYEIISKSMKNDRENLMKENCDDEEDCGSTDDMFSNDGSGEDIIKGDRSQGQQDSGKVSYYQVISKSMVRNEDLEPTDTFSTAEKSGIMLNKENKKPKYEIISVARNNGVEPDNDCDDEDECGSADDIFSVGDEKEIIRGLQPTKNKEKSSKKDPFYEILSTSEVTKDSNQRDTFTADELFKVFQQEKNREATYEIMSKSTEYGKTKQTDSDCNDEDECGSADDVFKNDKDGDVFRGLSTPIDTGKLSEKQPLYEVMSTSMEEKSLSKKDCDDEDECGSTDEVFVNDDRNDADSTDTDTFTSQKSKDASLSDGGSVATYEIISESMEKKEKTSKIGCVNEEDCEKMNEGSGDSIPPSKDKDQAPIDAFVGDESQKKTVRYQIISKSMKEADKVQPNSNCDDEDECRSSDGVFIDDYSFPNHDSDDDRNFKGLSPPKEKDSFHQDTFTADNGGEPRYEIVSIETKPGKKRKSSGCEDGQCPSTSYHGNDNIANPRRALMPPKYQLGAPNSDDVFMESIFHGTSFLELPSLGREAQDSIEAELEIFPLAKTGLIIYNGWEQSKIGDFISLSLQDGFVELSFDCRSGPAKIRTIQSIKMYEWNKVTFFRTGRLGSLTLNDGYSAIGLSPEPRSALTLHGKLIIGGFSEELRSEVKGNVGIERGFTGYIRNLKIQGEMVKLGTPLENMKDPCLPSPCKHGGECVKDRENYSCLCKRPYRGQNCSEEINFKAASFHKDSYVLFNKAALLKILQGEDGFVSFFIKSKQSKGLLIWETQELTEHFKRYAMVTLTVGFVSLSFNLGTGKRQVYSSIPVNDAQWHNITIARKDNSCALIIDQTHKTEFKLVTSDVSIRETTDLYIGGIPSQKIQTEGIHKLGFKGCLKNFQVNSSYLNFRDEYLASQGVGSCQST